MKQVGIIGMGKLGLCLALNLERAGFDVIGIDKDSDRVKRIREKTLQTSEPEVEQLLAACKNLRIESNSKALIETGMAVIFVVVPTPSLPSGAFSHAFIDRVVDELEAAGRPEKRTVLVINSTTMPGYCLSIHERLDRLNFDLVYNPEFIAQGSIVRDQRHPDQVLIGAQNPESAEKVKAVYEALCENKPAYCIMDLQSAEMAKLATNCFLTMKISFANHLGDLAEKVGADAEQILACVGADSRIGNNYLRYGFGYGGPCFPRDNQAFMQFGRENDHSLHLSEATDRINEEHFMHQLNALKASNQEEYFFEDVAYKPGTDIIEESQQLRLALALAREGAKVTVKASKALRETLEASFENVFHFEVE